MLDSVQPLVVHWTQQKQRRHTMEEQKKDVRLSIRISKDERDLIKKIADEENRTVSNYVINLVRADLEKKLKKI